MALKQHFRRLRLHHRCQSFPSWPPSMYILTQPQYLRLSFSTQSNLCNILHRLVSSDLLHRSIHSRTFIIVHLLRRVHAVFGTTHLTNIVKPRPLQALLNMIPGRARRPDGNAINMQPDRRVPPARDQIEGQMDHIRRQQEERNRMRRDRDRAHAEAAMQRANHLQAQALQLANRVNQQRLGLQHLQQGAENNRRIAEWQMQQIQQARRAVGPRGPQR